MGRSFIKIYFSFDKDTACLSDIEKGRLLLAMVRYAEDGIEPNLTGNERFLWPVIKGQIDREIDSYDKKIENGRCGGRPKPQAEPKETEINQTEPNKTEIIQAEPKRTETRKIEDKDKSEEEDKEKESKEKKRRFAPPTRDEVAAYCQERRNQVDPERFIDFYASKGWKVGNQSMVDWKAAVRTWEKDGTKQPARMTVSAQAYTQRSYAGEDQEAMNRMIRSGRDESG